MALFFPLLILFIFSWGLQSRWAW